MSQSYPPTTPETNGSRLMNGLKTVGRALWFLFSLLLYGLGTALTLLGQGLIRISGWERTYGRDRHA